MFEFFSIRPPPAPAVDSQAYGIVLPFVPRGPDEHSPLQKTSSPSSPSSAAVAPPTPMHTPKPAVCGEKEGADTAGVQETIAINRKSPPPPPPASYLCSQLVAAALSEMGVLREGGVGLGGKGGWLWVLPGAFGQGGDVERGLGVGVTLGDEVREQRCRRCLLYAWFCMVRLRKTQSVFGSFKSNSWCRGSVRRRLLCWCCERVPASIARP